MLIMRVLSRPVIEQKCGFVCLTPNIDNQLVQAVREITIKMKICENAGFILNSPWKGEEGLFYKKEIDRIIVSKPAKWKYTVRTQIDFLFYRKQIYHSPSRACSISSIKSSGVSRPTDKRINPSSIPTAIRSSCVMCS